MFVSLLAVAPFVHADTIITESAFALSFPVGSAFAVQDASLNLTLTFTVLVHALDGVGELELSSTGGNLTITPTSDTALLISDGGYTGALNIYVNGAILTTSFTVVLPYNVATQITWDYSGVPSPSTSPGVLFPNSIDTGYLWQYLDHWDIIGFVIACWTASLGESFYVILSMIVTVVFYLKLKNLVVMTIMWFLLGSIWIAVIPLASPLIYLLFILGIASLLFKLFGESKY